MKKPDWFILADADKPLDPVSSHIPFGVISFILVITIAAVFFFYPANSPTPAKIKAPVETIQTPILPEFTEDITPVFEDEYEDKEDDD
jgi:hypothetical protein